MRIIAKSTLRKFWETPQYSDAKGPLESWHDEVANAQWERLTLAMRLRSGIIESYSMLEATSTA